MSTTLSTDPTVQGFTRVRVAHSAAPLVATTEDEQNIHDALPPVVSLHSARHCDLLSNIAAFAHKPLTSPIEGLALVHADTSSEELGALLQRPMFAVTNLQVHGTICSSTGLASLLGSLSTAAKALDVGANPVCFSVGDEPSIAAVEALLKYLKENSTTLRKLGLSSTGLGPAATAVLPALTAHSGITNLDLSRNALGLGDEAAVAALVQLVQENKFLLSLNLEHNDIGPAPAKLLLDALQNSNTRVKTPEVEPDPEAEEFTDEVPPEEEAPTVTVGFPEEAVASEEPPAGSAGPADGDAPPPADVDVTAEPVEEGDGDGAEAAAPPAAESPAPTGEIDPEEAEALRQEALEREAEERRQKEAEWRAKMTQYIWEPEQILFAYSEGVARRLIIQDYVTESLALKQAEKLSKKEFKDLQTARERRERDRRSGWTHLQQLNLNGNPIGNDGAKALALAVRNRVPLPAEELAVKEEEAAQRLAALRAAALEERRSARKQQNADVSESPHGGEETSSPLPPPQGTEGDENTEDAPPAAPADVLDEVTVEDAPLNEGGEGDDQAGADTEGDAEQQDIDVSDITIPPIDGTRPGVTTISSLALNNCGIGVSGLVALAGTIASNLPTLEVLLLQKNKFGTKKQIVVGQAVNEDDEPPKTKVDMADWASPGIVALSQALATAPKLVTLDLGYNKLYPVNIRILAAGVRVSPSLQFLNLEGNYIGAPETAAAADRTSALAILLEAVATQGNIHSLVLGTNRLEETLTDVEWTLLSTIPQLRVLSLNNTALSNEQLVSWAKVLGDLSSNEDHNNHHKASVPLTNLEVLSMEYNPAVSGSVGGQALANIVAANHSLKELSLRSCIHLGDEGVRSLIPSVCRLSGLRKLDLHRTGITTLKDVSLVTAALALLEMIDVADNEVPAASGVKFLRECSSGVCGKLRGLSLWRRRGDSDALLADCIETILRLPSLVHCDVGIPLVFPAKGAENGFSDIFEELEVTSLANRVRAVAGM